MNSRKEIEDGASPAVVGGCAESRSGGFRSAATAPNKIDLHHGLGAGTSFPGLLCVAVVVAVAVLFAACGEAPMTSATEPPSTTLGVATTVNSAAGDPAATATTSTNRPTPTSTGTTAVDEVAVRAEPSGETAPSTGPDTTSTTVTSSAPTEATSTTVGAAAEESGGTDTESTTTTTGAPATTSTTRVPATTTTGAPVTGEISDDVPDIEMFDAATGELVSLRSVVKGEKPLLFWFWSPF